MDFAGPFYVSKGRGKPKEKRWILLFSCTRIRAVHLEMTPGMDVECVINAMKRFMARKGNPDSIYCDNGSSFVAAAKQIKTSWEELAERAKSAFHEVKFRFNPANAPNFGGHYERLIGCVKKAMKCLMYGGAMSDDIFHTVLTQAEVLVNSRPIKVRFIKGTDDPQPVTPDHFLLPRMYKRLPDMAKFDYGRLWQQREEALQMFLKQFNQNYFQQQQRDTQKHGVSYTLEPGDVVCDVSRKSDQTDYDNWPLGIVVKADPSDDGVVRRVIIRKSRTRKLVSRSAAHIIKMEGLDEETKRKRGEKDITGRKHGPDSRAIRRDRRRSPT